MSIIPIQQAWQAGPPGAGLDAESVENFLAGQYRVLRFFGCIGTRGMSLRSGRFDGQRVQQTRFGEHCLPQRQRRGRLVSGVVVGAPQRRFAVELLDDRNDHPCRIIDRRRVAAAIVGEQQLSGFLRTREKRPSTPSVLSSSSQPKRTSTCCGQVARTLCSIRHRA